MIGFFKTAVSLFMGGNALVRIGAYVIAGLTVAGGLWLHGYMSGRAGADHKALTQKIARLELALETSRKLQDSHDKQTASDDTLDMTNKELIDETPEDSRLCFSADHIKRLRQLR